MSERSSLRGTGRLLAVPLMAAALAACTDDMSDLRGYIAEVQQRPGGEIEPLPEMQTFDSYSYPEDVGRDPFERLSFAEPQTEASPEEIASGPVPDATRPRELLEDYTLDSLGFVGTLQRERELFALIRDPGGTIHRVQPGNHMGQNYGEITAITSTQVELRELIQTQRGTWIEREAAIALND